MLPTNGQQLPSAQEGGQIDFDQNPFADIIQAQAPQGQAIPPQILAAPTPQAEGLPPQAGGPQEAVPGVGPVGPEELQPGKTGDNSKPLLAAIHNLHNYISLSGDVDEIRIIRNLISALTQLVARDQQRNLEGGGRQIAPEVPQAPQTNGVGQQVPPQTPQITGQVAQ